MQSLQWAEAPIPQILGSRELQTISEIRFFGEIRVWKIDGQYVFFRVNHGSSWLIVPKSYACILANDADATGSSIHEKNCVLLIISVLLGDRFMLG